MLPHMCVAGSLPRPPAAPVFLLVSSAMVAVILETTTIADVNAFVHSLLKLGDLLQSGDSRISDSIVIIRQQLQAEPINTNTQMERAQ